MTDRDRIYLAAIKLPPSRERDLIIDGIVRAERQELLEARDMRRAPGAFVTLRCACDNGGDVVYELPDRRKPRGYWS